MARICQHREDFSTARRRRSGQFSRGLFSSVSLAALGAAVFLALPAAAQTATPPHATINDRFAGAAVNRQEKPDGRRGGQRCL